MWVYKKIAAYAVVFAALSLAISSVAQARTVTYDGLIQPNQVVEIGAPMEGIVDKVNVDRSSEVEAGQTLVALESSVERSAVEKAQAMAKFRGEIGLQQANLEFDKRVHRRLKRLNSVSAQDKDQAATEIELTRRRLEKARENSLLAEIELKKARAELSRCFIRSPISGVVVERYVSPGEYVDTKPLLRVAQIDPLRVEAIIPAEMFGKIKPGMTAAIVPELAQYGDLAAKVEIVDKVIDSASNTFGVRLELPNPEKKIPSGLRCEVRFEIEETADAAQTKTTETLSMAPERN
jgi:RND family efflux transporter MFP subunit